MQAAQCLVHEALQLFEGQVLVHGWRNPLSASLQRLGLRCSPVLGISYELALHSDMLTSGVPSIVLFFGVLWVWEATGGSVGFLQQDSCSEVRTAMPLSFGGAVAAGRDCETLPCH